MCMIVVNGVPIREIHQYAFMLGAMALFSLFLENIYLTLFMLWSIFLFAFFKFQVGAIYISNIFFGAVLYYATLKSFKKEHVNFFVNAVLWVCVVNVLYMCVQALGLEFIYADPNLKANTELIGFMGNRGMVGALFALSIPLLASRRLWLASTLLIPICLARGSINAVAAVAGYMFILFYRIPRKLFIGLSVMLMIFGLFYVTKIDTPGWERVPFWKAFMSDAMQHPVTGYGLDSFRQISPYKNFVYTTEAVRSNGTMPGSAWDNPHNLLISIFYEFGIIGIILLMGYVRSLTLKFNDAQKTDNTIALAGFILTFLVISMAYFPLFLARFAIFLIPAFALFHIQTEDKKLLN